MVCESLAWPKISSRAGSEMKKNLGKIKRLLSKYLESGKMNEELY